LLVVGKFLDPEAAIGGWCRRSFAAVPMPEAAVHKNRLFESWQNDIGASWKVRSM
jgi:hypothetical protein